MIKYGFERSYLNESAGFYGKNLNSRDESYEADVYLCKLLAKKEKCNWKDVQLVSDNHKVPGYEMFDTIDKSMSDKRCTSKPIDMSDYDDPDDPGYRATLIQNSEGCYTIRLYDEYSKVTTYFINPATWSLHESYGHRSRGLSRSYNRRMMNESKSNKPMNEALSARAKKFAEMYAYLEDEANSRGATAKRATKWMEDLDGIMIDNLPGLTDSPAYDFDQIKDKEVQDLLWDKACTVTGLYESYERKKNE